MGHPYALGVAARSPILVLDELGPPTFERGEGEMTMMMMMATTKN